MTDHPCTDCACTSADIAKAGGCPAKRVSLNRHKRWDMPYDDEAAAFDHDEGPGLLSSRYFWVAVLAGWGIVGLCVLAYMRWAS